jgi:four helix bundle protein
LAAYDVTRAFPGDERYGLTSQIRRAAGSVCANIAEGCGRGSAKDFARFLNIARGSASELEHHIILARDLRLLDNTQSADLGRAVVDVKRMLTGLIRRLGETS